jgi:hypothetical protein
VKTYRYENQRKTKEEMDCGIEDTQIIGIRRRRKQYKERAEWKTLTEKAKTTVGFNASKSRRSIN